MTKQEFIQALENGAIPFFENQRQLAQLDEQDFAVPTAAFTAIDQRQWTSRAFFTLINELKHLCFDRQRIEQAIAIKKYLQQQNIEKGFTNVLLNAEKPLTATTPQTEQPTITQAAQNSGTATAATANADTTTANADTTTQTPLAYTPAEPDLSTFQANETLAALLEEKDIAKIRAYLMALLNNRRRSLAELLNTIYFVKKQQPDVFAATKDSLMLQAINPDQAAWNKQYFYEQQNSLNLNFTLERILHLYQVRSRLKEKGAPDFQPIIRKPTPQSEANTGSTQQRSAQRTTDNNHTASHSPNNDKAAEPVTSPSHQLPLNKLAVAAAIIGVVIISGVIVWLVTN